LSRIDGNCVLIFFFHQSVCYLGCDDEERVDELVVFGDVKHPHPVVESTIEMSLGWIAPEIVQSSVSLSEVKGDEMRDEIEID